MITVYKYLLPAAPGDHLMEMPFHAEILTTRGMELNDVSTIGIWARVDTDNEIHIHQFHVIETGKEAPPLQRYLGSAFFMDGRYILHVFDGG